MPLLIGNIIESIIRLSLGRDWLLDGMRRRAGVALHCLLLRNTDPPSRIARNRFFEPDFPLWIEMRRAFRSHPRRESFIQPEIVPPRHRHQIAEPLVGDFVGDDFINPLLCCDRRILRVEQ